MSNTPVGFDVEQIRRDFPVLDQVVHGHPLAYLDNAATTQKPRAVIDAIAHYYAHDNANVHRGVHALSVRATNQYEAVREKVRAWINAASVTECIFVRGATEAINLVANSFARVNLRAGDEVLITHMEHHANIVPWQMACDAVGATLRAVPMNVHGDISLQAFEEKLSKKTRFVAITHASNAIGVINPIKQMVQAAKAYHATVLVDGAQAAAHLPVDVQDLGCDFYVFSAHKMYGPTGVGVLWGRKALLDAMPPYQGGGDMIETVHISYSTYAPLPGKFEAGTPNISGVIGFGAALDYLSALDSTAVKTHESALLAYATDAIESLPGFRILGHVENKLSIISFVHERIHSHDIGTILDSLGLALRSGHHCAMPLMEFFGVPATTRLSLSFYNTQQEIDRCIDGLQQINRMFA
ncbi:MAG: cysteine desulfurase [Legionellaceae bacterium]|nr:cysteine desulfurase [Legionellaceae bacterium]